METSLQHAQGLVYSLLCLMPSAYQKASLKALLGLFLDAQGHALPAHTSVKSASSLSRFLNRLVHSPGDTNDSAGDFAADCHSSAACQNTNPHFD